MNVRAIRLWLVAACLPVTVTALGQSPSSDDRVIDRLLALEPGAYAVHESRVDAIEETDAPDPLVQMDGFRRGIEGVHAALAIGALADGPWALGVRIVNRQTPADRPVTTFSANGRTGALRRIETLTLKPGSYEAVVAFAIRRSGGWIGRLTRHALDVPRLPVDGLRAGPVVLAEKAETVPVTDPNAPFVFGRNRLTPAVTTRFPQKGAVHVATRVLGWKPDRASMPDLKIEYVFRQQIGNKWRFFNKTQPQALNAATIGSGFDPASQSVAAGMSVPLGAFSPGEFEMEVRVHDNQTGTSASHSARFTVY